jgi:hypothetical protein
VNGSAVGKLSATAVQPKLQVVSVHNGEVRLIGFLGTQ